MIDFLIIAGFKLPIKSTEVLFGRWFE